MFSGRKPGEYVFVWGRFTKCLERGKRIKQYSAVPQSKPFKNIQKTLLVRQTQEANRRIFRREGGGGGSKRPLTHRHTKRKAKETISREEMICKLKQIKEELNMSKLCRYFWSILITHAKYLRLDR